LNCKYGGDWGKILAGDKRGGTCFLWGLKGWVRKVGEKVGKKLEQNGGVGESGGKLY
jgi:hypothetical protein